MHELKTDFINMQTNFRLLGCFRKDFTTHPCCKLPLYIVQSAKRQLTCDFSKRHENL